MGLVPRSTRLTTETPSAVEQMVTCYAIRAKTAIIPFQQPNPRESPPRTALSKRQWVGQEISPSPQRSLSPLANARGWPCGSCFFCSLSFLSCLGADEVLCAGWLPPGIRWPYRRCGFLAMHAMACGSKLIPPHSPVFWVVVFLSYLHVVNLLVPPILRSKGVHGVSLSTVNVVSDFSFFPLALCPLDD